MILRYLELALMQSVRSGDVKEVKDLIQRGAGCNGANYEALEIPNISQEIKKILINNIRWVSTV